MSFLLHSAMWESVKPIQILGGGGAAAPSAGNVAAGLEASDHPERAKNTGSESQTSVHTTAR